MARSRVVKPEFFKDAELYDAEARHAMPLRLAYEGLWCQADREGRFAWKPRELKLDVLPFDPVDFAKVLDALEAEGFIRSYEVDGRRYGVIPNLKHHQHFHVKEAASKIPPPPEPGASTSQAPGKPESSTPDSDTGSDTGSDADADVGPRRRQVDRCRREMPDTYRPALEGALKSARNPDALAAELCMIADGGHGTAYPWEVIGKALHDMAVAGTQMGANTLRAFCRKAAEAPRSPPIASTADEVRRQVEEIQRKREERIRRRA